MHDFYSYSTSRELLLKYMSSECEKEKSSIVSELAKFGSWLFG